MSTSKYAFTPEELTMLPDWAKWKVERLEQDRATAIRALGEFTDAQTPSPVSVSKLVILDEYTMPLRRTSYVQADNASFVWKGVKLNVHLREEDHMHRDCIQLQWSAESSASKPSMTPVGVNAIELTASSIVKQYTEPKP